MIKNISYVCAIICIYSNTITLIEAQKVWKLGFDAELSLYNRILKRYEISSNFIPTFKYTIIQGGAPSLRHKYYQETYKYPSDDLLSTSYVPGMNSGIMWNYYAPQEYANNRSYFYNIQNSNEIQKIIAHAQPYPHKDSVIVQNNNIYLFLTPNGINSLKSLYHSNNNKN